jgi:hypothetical protein
MVISEAERLAEELNYEFGNKTKAKGDHSGVNVVAERQLKIRHS